MSTQLDLFAPKPVGKRSKKPGTAQKSTPCPLHAEGYVCPSCDDGSATSGLTPVRLCKHCGYPVTLQHWDTETSACTYTGCLERR